MASRRKSGVNYYRDLFRTCIILPKWRDRVTARAQYLVDNRDEYEDAVAGTDVPWIFVALIHEMECSANFERQILNGQKWTKRTTIVPKGKGPWDSWIESTRYALIRYTTYKAWSLAHILQRMELHNGWGYRSRGVHSPYLWSGTNHGLKTGKYTKDGVYSKTAVSRQVGAGAILHLLRHDLDIDLGTHGEPEIGYPVIYDRYGEYISSYATSLQVGLNACLVGRGLAIEHIREDGWAGKATSDALHIVTGQYLKGDPRAR